MQLGKLGRNSTKVVFRRQRRVPRRLVVISASHDTRRSGGCRCSRWWCRGVAAAHWLAHQIRSSIATPTERRSRPPASSCPSDTTNDTAFFHSPARNPATTTKPTKNKTKSEEKGGGLGRKRANGTQPKRHAVFISAANRRRSRGRNARSFVPFISCRYHLS